MIDRRAFLGGMAALAALPASPAPLASAWSRGSHSAVRLVAGERRAVPGGEIVTAGLEFELKKGFHTYWREPGDSGVPAMFDWSGAENVAGVEVLWPAPRRFRDASGYFIGYGKGLLLPLHVEPRDTGKPVRLALKVDYAVCETICVPASGEAALVLDPAAGVTGRFAGAIAAAEARVPVKTAPGEVANGLCVRGARVVAGATPRIDVEVVFPARDAADGDLFAEGPMGASFGMPEARPDNPTTLGVPLTARPKAGGRSTVRLTLVAGAHAVETPFDLDLPGKTP